MPKHRQRPRYVLAILVAKREYEVAGLEVFIVQRSIENLRRWTLDEVQTPRSILHLLDSATATRTTNHSHARQTIATRFVG